MDFDKLFKFSIDYFSDYFHVFFLTLQNPKICFSPVATDKRPDTAKTQKGKEAKTWRLNPKLFGYVLISILIGTAIGSLARGIKFGFDFASTMLLLVSWLFYSFIIHLLCRMLGGKGTFVETLSMSLQVFGAIYVVSNFVEFLWAMLLPYASLHNFLKNIDAHYFYNLSLASQPTAFYFLVQFILLAIYLPLGSIRVHELDKGKKVFAIILFACVFVLNAALLLYLARVGAGVMCSLAQYGGGDICR